MPLPNFSFLACPEVAENFVLVGGFQVSTMSNLNQSCFELELGVGFDNIVIYDSIRWMSKII